MLFVHKLEVFVTTILFDDLDRVMILYNILEFEFVKGDKICLSKAPLVIKTIKNCNSTGTNTPTEFFVELCNVISIGSLGILFPQI